MQLSNPGHVFTMLFENGEPNSIDNDGLPEKFRTGHPDYFIYREVNYDEKCC